MKNLTERQQHILHFIQEEVRLHGMPPTMAEIATAMGFKSSNGARDHLKALERKGVLELIPGASRGIRLIDMGAAQNDEMPDDWSLPLVGHVAAGNPILASENVESHYRVDPLMFSPRADYFLRVRGMSMKDVGILDGDLLAVHKTNQANNGEVVVARVADEVTVKRLEINQHLALLHPENDEFSTIKVDMRQTELVIEGLAVGVIRNNRL